MATTHLIPRAIINGHVYHKPDGKPYAYGSTQAAINRAVARHMDGIDWDRRVDEQGNGWWFHQLNPTRRDGWYDPAGHIKDSHRSDRLSSAQIRRLRYRDPSTHKVYAVMDDRTALTRLKAAGLIPCVEDKSYRGHTKAHWQKFKALCDEIGIVPIIMSLPGSKSVPGARKLKTAHDAGLVTMWLWRSGSKVPDFVDLVKSHGPIHRVSKRGISGPAPKPPAPKPQPKPPAPKPPTGTARIERGFARAAAQSKSGPRFPINECKKRVRMLVDVPSDGAGNATTAWQRTDHKHTGRNAQRGGFFWFTGGSSGDGHVTYATGNGEQCWSTDIKRGGYFDLTTVTEILRTWPKLRYVGWSEDIDGVRIVTPSTPAPTPPPPRPQETAMKLITQKQWGCPPGIADKDDHPIGATKGVTIHWEGTHLGPAAHDKCDERIRSIDHQHRAKNWQGIAYNLIVCSHGFVFEGRGAGVRSAANGSTQTNDDWYAVCYLGGEGDGFTKSGETAMHQAVNYLRGAGAGRAVNGHRDHKATQCPGATIYSWLQHHDFDAGVPPVKPPPKPNRVQRAIALSDQARGVQREAIALLDDVLEDDPTRVAVAEMRGAWAHHNQQIAAATEKGPSK